MAEKLKDVEYEYDQAAVFEYAGEAAAGYNMSEALLYLLVLLLIGEQLLARSASYHPPGRRGRQAKGGAR